jgi:hypothetical protein
MLSYHGKEYTFYSHAHVSTTKKPAAKNPSHQLSPIHLALSPLKPNSTASEPIPHVEHSKLFRRSRSSNDSSFFLYDTATLYTLVRSKIRLIITHSRVSKSETTPFII